MYQRLSLLVLGLALTCGGAFAAAPVSQAGDTGCQARAAEKKLAGAAKASFLKKCDADAGASTCTTQAADKKLAGAAKASFVKKCEADAKTAGK